MKETSRLALELAKLGVDAERLTPAGRLNAFGLVLVFAILVGLGLFDAIQSIVRIWRPRYTNGLPSLVVLLAVFAGMFLFCVLIVSRLGRGDDGG